MKTSKFLVACDVDNPIYGLTGAAHVYGKQKGASKEEIHFFVIDNGIGISKEDQESIFKPFLKGNNAKFSSKGGMGVGLTIAKQLVELMGGTLGIPERNAEGTELLFTVPYLRLSKDVPLQRN